MDPRSELREFLASRRANVTPQQAGLPSYGTRRRVPGLRREEVATLSGVSVEYYTRLERGSASGVSDSVLEALARALRLDDAERAHLFGLTRSLNTSARARRQPVAHRVRLGVQQLLDSMGDVPAFVQNGRLDLLATNALARALYGDVFAFAAASGTDRVPNSALFTFLDPRAVELYPEWNRVAGDTVAMLRAETGRNPDDRELSDLIGELTTRSEHFSALWATHDVRVHTTGTKQFHHRVAGELTLTYEALDLAADHGQTLVTFTAPPDTTSRQALAFLSSWAASSAETAATRY